VKCLKTEFLGVKAAVERRIIKNFNKKHQNRKKMLAIFFVCGIKDLAMLMRA